jgi:glycosyltransferase involved in cell wall biosynthesis
MIQDWVDIDLLAQVASQRPDWSIILIGEPLTDVSPLSGLANVHLLGRRPYKVLPRYAKCFDVGLIPFRVNDLTRAVNPIKLREYLSAGLPVVSTPMPEVQGFGGDVLVANGPQQFVSACERAIQSNSPARIAARQAAMRQQSWPAKVEEVCRHAKPIHCSGWT